MDPRGSMVQYQRSTFVKPVSGVLYATAHSRRRGRGDDARTGSAYFRAAIRLDTRAGKLLTRRDNDRRARQWAKYYDPAIGGHSRLFMGSNSDDDFEAGNGAQCGTQAWALAQRTAGFDRA